MEIAYQEATASDAKELLIFLKQVAEETNNLTFTVDELKLNELQEIEYIKEFNQNKYSVMIIAKDGNKVVGCVSLSNQNHRRIEHHSNLGISVLKDYWHQGIGSNLMAAAIGYAIENEIEIIDLEVIETNEHAIALYEKFGFEEIGIYYDYFNIDGQYYDAKLMNLYL